MERIIYLCQTCSRVLSVGLDPIALKSDIVSGVTAELRELKS